MSSLLSEDHPVVPTRRGGCWLAIAVAVALAGCGGITKTSDPDNSADVIDSPAANSSVRGDTPPSEPADQRGTGAGIALGTCDGGGILVCNGQLSRSSTNVGHIGGRWYFEATVEQFEPGWSSVGVYAPPTDLHYLVAPVSYTGGSAGGFTPTRPSTVGVAADLDAGQVRFYVDGVLTSERSLTLAPGVGPFLAGAVSSGSSMRINFGSEPFAYGVPPGYEPWFGGDEDASGACIPDTGTPAPPAPVKVDCAGVNECFPTSFQASTSADTDLVVLGVYDSGGDSGWVWGTDANGEPVQVTTGPARRGSILVDVKRPGRVALVLTAYEPTDWAVRSGASTQLASVSAYGMYRPTVSGLGSDVPLDIHTICRESDGRNCTAYSEETFPVGAYQWPHSTGGGDTQGFVRHVEERLGLPLKMFAGAYRARGFVVE